MAMFQRVRSTQRWTSANNGSSVFATTPRFKAATSGAGSALQLSMYGTDQYIYQYENELGAPWKNQELWIKISYPFFHADRITTPTTVLWPEHDPLFPREWSDNLNAFFAAVDLRSLDGVGHYSPLEAPTAFAAAIRA